jgi:hypothetical protein
MLVRQYRSGQSKRGATLVFVCLLVFIGSIAKANGQGNKPFYDGKTIQLLVSSGPGATTDISARLVARYLGKHLPGHPGIVVQNMSGGGGLVAANYLYNVAKADGDFAAEAKKLLDWEGATYLSGGQLQKKIIDTVTQPPDVIKKIKEILAES